MRKEFHLLAASVSLNWYVCSCRTVSTFTNADLWKSQSTAAKIRNTCMVWPHWNAAFSRFLCWLRFILQRTRAEISSQEKENSSLRLSLNTFVSIKLSSLRVFFTNFTLLFSSDLGTHFITYSVRSKYEPYTKVKKNIFRGKVLFSRYSSNNLYGYKL